MTNLNMLLMQNYIHQKKKKLKNVKIFKFDLNNKFLEELMLIQS